jgi:hypothetical protein
MTTSVAHGIARLLYEITINAEFPLHIWGVAMLFYFTFHEFTDDDSDEKKSRSNIPLSELMLGVTALVLAVKSNENFLLCRTEAARNVGTHNRFVSLVLDSASRVIISYSSDNQVSVEKLTKMKRKMREFIPQIELGLMRVIGNSLQPETVFGCLPEINPGELSLLVEIYSSPVCLNFTPQELGKYVRNLAEPSIYQAICYSFSK